MHFFLLNFFQYVAIYHEFLTCHIEFENKVKNNKERVPRTSFRRVLLKRCWNQTNVSILLRLHLCRGDTDMDRKMLQSPYVLLQDCGSSTPFSLLLSSALNLWVGLNDPCVLGICYPKLGVCTQHHTSGMAQVKCRSQIVTHMWEQEKASLFSFGGFFLSPSSRWFLYFQDGGWEKNKKLWNL